MEIPTQQQNLVDLSLAVRKSSLKRFRIVPEGKENWRLTPESMSIADVAQHLIHADNWLSQKLGRPAMKAIDGNPGEVTIANRAEYDALVEELVATGDRRAELLRTISDDALAKRIPDERYGDGEDSTIWWVIVRGNLDHEIHHRGALAVYLRVLKEREGAPIGVLP